MLATTSAAEITSWIALFEVEAQEVEEAKNRR